MLFCTVGFFIIVSNGVLTRKWETPVAEVVINQVVVPRIRVKEILQKLHSSGHFDVKKTVNKLRESAYRVQFGRNVEEFCRDCTTCTARRGPTSRSHGKIMHFNVGAPFERMAIDITTNSGNKVLFVIIDYFTKRPEVNAFSFDVQNRPT